MKIEWYGSARCKPVAELRPAAPAALSADALLARWRRLPPVDPDALPVYAANPDDFAGIEGLEVMAVERSSVDSPP